MWEKKGLIFSVDNISEEMKSHVLGPTVVVNERSFRIFFSSRDQDQTSRPFYIDVDKTDPSKIIHIETTPLFHLGDLGTFDDDGVMPCSAVDLGKGVIRLYYVGWNRGVTVSYRNSIGLAVSHDGGARFERMYEGPVIDRSFREPHMAASPCVLKVGDVWKCWYTSGTRWITVEGKTEPIYTIRYAESADGVNWERDGRHCLNQRCQQEAFARPTVLKISGKYRMWYSFRESHDYRGGAGSYRIGYAESLDGRIWSRLDSEAGIGASEEGWDSEMLCYPCVVRVGENLVMFYNGNGFGKSGLGFATRTVDSLRQG